MLQNGTVTRLLHFCLFTCFEFCLSSKVLCKSFDLITFQGKIFILCLSLDSNYETNQYQNDAVQCCQEIMWKTFK